MSLATTLDAALWRRARRAPEHAETFLVDTATTTVRLRDSAPGSSQTALVILCDPPNMVDHYDSVIAALAPQRVVIVELPGFGFSGVKRGDALTPRGTVKALTTALRSLGAPELVICGPCICGFAATALAQAGELPITGLVLVQTPDADNMLAWANRMDPKRQLRTPVVGQLMMRLGAKKLTSFWYRFATPKAFDHQVLDDIAQAQIKRGAAYSLASMLQTWDAAMRDAALQMPTLVIWGRQDRSHAETDPNSSLAHAAGADICCVDHCGHFPDLEDPVHFAGLVKPFLAKTFAQTQ